MKGTPGARPRRVNLHPKDVRELEAARAEFEGTWTPFSAS